MNHDHILTYDAVRFDLTKHFFAEQSGYMWCIYPRSQNVGVWVADTLHDAREWAAAREAAMAYIDRLHDGIYYPATMYHIRVMPSARGEACVRVSLDPLCEESIQVTYDIATGAPCMCLHYVGDDWHMLDDDAGMLVLTECLHFAI